jgi:hypothetical protein
LLEIAQIMKAMKKTEWFSRKAGLLKVKY